MRRRFEILFEVVLCECLGCSSKRWNEFACPLRVESRESRVAQWTGGEFPGEGTATTRGLPLSNRTSRRGEEKAGGASGLQRRMDGCRDFLTTRPALLGSLTGVFFSSCDLWTSHRPAEKKSSIPFAAVAAGTAAERRDESSCLFCSLCGLIRYRLRHRNSTTGSPLNKSSTAALLPPPPPPSMVIAGRALP